MAKLFMTLIGCTPAGRNIEQHDVFFGIGNSLKDIVMVNYKRVDVLCPLPAFKLLPIIYVFDGHGEITD